MRHTLGPIGFIAVAATLCTPAQQVEVPLGDLVSAASEQMIIECERLLAVGPLPSELAEREAEMGAAVFCDCMPPALAALGQARGSQTLMTGEEFGALVLREFDVCATRTVRESTRRSCPQFAPPAAPPTYCECFTAAVDGLTDDQIVEDSLASRQNLEQRLAARRNSTPEPPLYEGLLARIDERCQQPTPAQ
ncbi:MAG: hypothetical protein EHM50_04980 [Lysobacterales bacterium]|nr:MAG: hypothetical protein EHM50_04980 [Xanthomonadales bacterium]